MNTEAKAEPETGAEEPGQEVKVKSEPFETPKTESIHVFQGIATEHPLNNPVEPSGCFL